MKGTSVKDVCAKYGVAEAEYYKWRNQEIEAVKAGFADQLAKGET